MEKITRIEDIKPYIMFHRGPLSDSIFDILDYYKLSFFRRPSGWYEIEAKTFSNSKNYLLPPDSPEREILEVYNEYVCNLCVRGYKPLGEYETENNINSSE